MVIKRLSNGLGEETTQDNMEALYASLWLLITEEEDDIPFPYCKVVGEYRNDIEPSSLSDIFLCLCSHRQ